MIDKFCDLVRTRSAEHHLSMSALLAVGSHGQMVSILRQEIDSFIRVIYLLHQPVADRTPLLERFFKSGKWTKDGSKGRITDREMVDLASNLQGYIRRVYDIGCALIHLSPLHDHAKVDVFDNLKDTDRHEIIDYLRFYHGFPSAIDVKFVDVIPFIPKVLKKISENLDYYLDELKNNTEPDKIY